MTVGGISSSDDDGNGNALQFMDQVRQQNELFLKEQKRLPEFKQRAIDMQTEITRLCVDKINIRAVLELRRDLGKLEQQIKDVETRKKQQAYTNRVMPLVKRYREQVEEISKKRQKTTHAAPQAPPPPVLLRNNKRPRPPESAAPPESESGSESESKSKRIKLEDDGGGDVADAKAAAAPAVDTTTMEVHEEECFNDYYQYDEDDDDENEYDSPMPVAPLLSDTELTVATKKRGSGGHQSQTTTTQSLQQPYVGILTRMMSPDKVVPQFVQRDECRDCHSDMIKVKADAQLVCPKCSTSSNFLNSTSEALAFGEEVEIPEHVYMRVKHFRGWLSQFRIGAAPVPDNVIIAVDRCFRDIHDNSTRKVRPTPVREILRKLKLQMYGSVATIITHRLNNKPIAKLTDAEFDRILWRFDMIQVPFILLKNDERTNFINFNYCVHKFTQMEGWDHFSTCFPLLKTRKVLKGLDEIFAKICSELQKQRRHPSDPQWIFKPSE